jgi:hypothetical protein
MLCWCINQLCLIGHWQHRLCSDCSITRLATACFQLNVLPVCVFHLTNKKVHSTWNDVFPESHSLYIYHEILGVLRNLKFHYRIHKMPLVDSVLSHSNPTQSFTSSLMVKFFLKHVRRHRDGSGWSTTRPGIFTPGEESRYPLYRRLSGYQDQCGRERNISPPPGGCNPQTFSP